MKDHPENEPGPDPEVIEAMQRFRDEYGHDPDPDNPEDMERFTFSPEATERLVRRQIEADVEAAFHKLILDGEFEVKDIGEGGVRYGPVEPNG